MSLIQTDVSNPLGTKIAKESTAKASIVNQIDTTAGTIYQIEVNNSGKVTVFLKLWQGVSQAPTVGSDAPDWIFRCLSGKSVNISLPGGMAYTTALWAAVVEGTGGTAGTTDPSGVVTYSIRYTT